MVAAAAVAAVVVAAAGIGIDTCQGPAAAGRLGWAEISTGVSCSRSVYAFITLMKEENIEIEGSIQTVLPGTMFRVELDNKHLVLATISGKMRKRWVRLTVGDRVKMEMSPYDMDKARIIWRLQDEPKPENRA